MSGGSLDYLADKLKAIADNPNTILDATGISDSLLKAVGYTVLYYDEALPFIKMLHTRYQNLYFSMDNYLEHKTRHMELIPLPQQEIDDFNETVAQLYDYLYALEWHRSGDWTEQPVFDALEQLKGNFSA